MTRVQPPSKPAPVILAATRELAARTRRQIDLPGLFSYYKAEWLQTEPAPDLPSPLVYLVEQPPHSVLPAHFHRQNQFQVFVGGGGTFGPRPITRGMVHYANAYTGYGPIIAGDEGVRYFTIRAVFDSGAFMIDSQRDAMVRGPKRNLHGDSGTPLDAPHLATFGSIRRETLFPPQPDALQAERISAPPSSPIELAAPEGLGVFCLVLEGSIGHGRLVLGRHESLYLSPDEPATTLMAGSGGADLLRLQVPRLAPEYSLNH